MPEIVPPPYHYVAYIDEAGDPGLERVKPLDNPGSSEWLVLSAVLIGTPNEPNIVPWVSDILKKIRSQREHLHFTDLRPWNKRIVCNELATLPARFFVVCSNKKNMKGYRNPMAEKYPSPNWFYAWLSRLLLERVTHFVEQKSIAQHGEVKKVRLEFSARGGLTYPEISSYYRWLKIRAADGQTFLPLGNLAWDTMDENLIHIYQHRQRAGLQLADTIASAFYKGIDYCDTGECDCTYAKLLEPRMGRAPDGADGQISGYSVKLMPQFTKAALLPAQTEIFTHYGYPKQWWAPNPVTIG